MLWARDREFWTHQLRDVNQGLELSANSGGLQQKLSSAPSESPAQTAVPAFLHFESPSDSILQLWEGCLPAQVRPFQAQVFLVIFLIQLQWSPEDQPHSSATSLMVWRFLAASTSQVHISKALRRQSSGWEDNTGEKQRVSLGDVINVCSSSLREKQSGCYSRSLPGACSKSITSLSIRCPQLFPPRKDQPAKRTG